MLDLCRSRFPKWNCWSHWRQGIHCRSVSQMLRACLAVRSLVLAIAGTRAGRDRNRDLPGCQAARRGPAHGLHRPPSRTPRSPASPRPSAHWYVGDSLAKKRDYDGAHPGLQQGAEADPENVYVLNSRGIAYGNKGDDESRAGGLRFMHEAAPEFRPRRTTIAASSSCAGATSISPSRNSASPSSSTPRKSLHQSL